MLRKRFAAVLVAAPLALAPTLSGCSAFSASRPGSTEGSAAPSVSSSPRPGGEVDKDAFFAAAQKAVLDAKTYTMTMRMEQGKTVTTMTGKGDLSDQRRPKADMALAGPDGSHSRMILDGEAVYLQIPGVAAKGKFVKMPMEALGRMNGQDVDQLVNPAENLKLTQQAVERVVYQGDEQQGGQTLRHYSVTMNPRKLQQNLATQAPSATMPAEPLPYDVWVDPQNRLRKMTMNVTGTAMTMTADKYGEPVTITPPPQASVTTVPGLSGSTPSASTAAPTATPSPVPTATPTR